MQDWLEALDPGIRAAVAALDAAGIETFESCEGGGRPCFPGADDPVPR